MKARFAKGFLKIGLLVLASVLLFPSAKSGEIAPRLRGSLTLPGPISHLKLRGSYAFAAAGARGVVAIDLSTPTAPRVVGEIKTPNPANKILLAGSHAFVLDAIRGLQVIDISDPAALRIVGAAIMDGCNDFAVVGSAVYALSQGTVIVLDATDPSHPVRRDTISGLYIDRIAANDRVLCIIPREPGADAKLFDLVDPFHPRPVSTIPAPKSGGGWNSFINIEAVGNAISLVAQLYWLCCEGTGVYPDRQETSLYDVSNPHTPLYRAGSIGQNGAWTDGPYWFEVSANGFKMFEKTPAGESFSRAFVSNVNATSRGITYADHVFMPSGDQLLIYDLPLANPRSSSTILDGHVVLDVVAQGDYAFLATAEGLKIIDARNSARPELVGEVALPAPNSVLVRGDYAYLSGNSGLDTIDIRNPHAPTQTSHIDQPLQQIAFVGDRIYGCNPPYNVYLVGFDLSVPSTPDLRWPKAPGSGAWQGQFMYGVSAPFVFLATATINTSNFTWTSRAPFNGANAMQLHFSADRVYITRSGKFEILNLTNAYNVIGFTTSFGGQVTVLGQFAYVATGSSLEVIDISQETAPRVVARNDSLAAYRTYSDGQRLFIASYNDGFSIMEPHPQVWLQTRAANPPLLILDGPPALSGQLQRSTNLIEWEDWLPVTFGDEPTVLELPRHDSHNLYRFRLPSN